MSIKVNIFVMICACLGIFASQYSQGALSYETAFERSYFTCIGFIVGAILNKKLNK